MSLKYDTEKRYYKIDIRFDSVSSVVYDNKTLNTFIF